jgi:hypothetical protein
MVAGLSGTHSVSAEEEAPMCGRVARTGVAFVICLVLAGCAIPTGSGGAGSIVGTGKDNASVVTCRTNRAQLDQQYSMVLSGVGQGSTDFAAFVKEQGAKCPSGGSYSWDAAKARTRCSVHGE